MPCDSLLNSLESQESFQTEVHEGPQTHGEGATTKALLMTSCPGKQETTL